MTETTAQRKIVEIFTDGACTGNPGPGGWGAILQYEGREKEISGFEPHTTNNRMEMRAVLEALTLLKEPCIVRLHTDSQYLKNGITTWIKAWKRNAWKTSTKSPVKNKDLWTAIDEAAQRHEVQWFWIKGHAGHPQNERADELARVAIRTGTKSG